MSTSAFEKRVVACSSKATWK